MARFSVPKVAESTGEDQEYHSMSEPQSISYKRILLKLSGEALRAPGSRDNISPEIVARIAREIAEAQKIGNLQIAVVVGGGNIWRGAKASVRGMDRATADYVGMLATVMNALSICSAVQEAGVPCHVQSAIEMKNVAEPYVRNTARELLRKGQVIVFAAGTGNPFFSTDTAAALRACEINAEVVLKATSVDGVYTADPKQDPGATRFDTISYRECIERNLKVMDQTAASLIQNSDIEIRVFAMQKGNMLKVLSGDNIGTTIRKE